VSPSVSGLMIAPLMGGLIVASVIGGHLVSTTGRYKVYPIIGLILAVVAYVVLSWAALAAMGGLMVTALVFFGFGFGLVMPTLTVAIQNGVARADLGVATSASTFLRSLGIAMGVALAGAIMAWQLAQLHPDRAIALGGEGAKHCEEGLEKIRNLPPEERMAVVTAYQQAIGRTLFSGGVLALLAFLAVLLLPERHLRSASDSEEVAEMQSAERMPGTFYERKPEMDAIREP
jgi:MFS family permease